MAGINRPFIALAVAVLATTARAGVEIHVDAANCPGPGSGSEGDPFCSIQDAVDAAADTDEIVVEQGTYVGAIDLLGKAITLRSTDPLNPAVVAATIIDGDGALHAVQCVSGEGAGTVLDGFTITGGSADGIPLPDYIGGGMLLYDSSCPTVSNCTFTANTARYGGGLGVYGGCNPSVIGCTFLGNTATELGGGLWENLGDATVTACVFTGNTAYIRGGGMYSASGTVQVIDSTFTSNAASADTLLGCCADGGGLYVHSPVTTTISGCTFDGNTAANFGGGMSSSNFAGTVTDCTFTNNTSGTSGAGWHNVGDNEPTIAGCTFSGNDSDFNGGGLNNEAGSSPTIIGCIFDGNTATGNGGGMSNNLQCNPVVINCLFVGNTAGGDGGGMSVNSNVGASTPHVFNSTFTENTASGVGGGFRANQPETTPTVANCILWGNSAPQLVDEGGAVSTVTYSDVQGGFAGTGNVDLDPLFTDAEGRLGRGSPAIDAGDNTVPALATITTDLDGNPRFVDDAATADGGNGKAPIIDMGAFEYTAQCPWDCEGADGVVGINDFLALLSQWSSVGTPCDIDGAGVGINDFLDLLAHWGSCP